MSRPTLNIIFDAGDFLTAGSRAHDKAMEVVGQYVDTNKEYKKHTWQLYSLDVCPDGSGSAVVIFNVG